MSHSPYVPRYAQRIGGARFGQQSTYKFARIKQAKAQALLAQPHRRLLDCGIGQPQGLPPAAAIAALKEATHAAAHHAYSDTGCAEFRHAAAQYMQRTFGVALNPETQLMHCMGIKAALSILPHCFVDPGDLVLWPVPSYPIGGVHARFCGGTLHELPLLADNGFLPDLASLTPAVAQAAKVLFLNYPHNPTGAQATLAFFQQAVALAHRYGWLIIQDAAYAGLVHPGQKPLSILSVPGALEVAVELHSLSKPYNMTGWRLGWVCGAAHAVKAYTHVKEQTDSGQFLPIQWGGIAALQDDAFPQACAKLYAQRLADLLHVLGHSGWHLPVERRPRAGFFLYMPAPAQATHSSGQCVSFATAQDCTEWLITELGIVAVPWDELQPSVRFAVTWGQDEVDFIQQLAARLQGWSFHGLLSGPYAS